MNNYKLSLVTAPATEPVTLTEVKAFLRIDNTNDDTLLTSLISVARTAAENYTRRAFISQTWKMYMDKWDIKSSNIWWDGVKELPISYVTGKQDIEIPLAPLISVTHLKTYDDTDAATTFSNSNYFVSVYSGDYAQNGRIVLRDGQAWPTFERPADGIEIQFVAGYGASASNVPYAIKQAILQEVAFIYEHRVSCSGDSVSSDLAKVLLEPFRLLSI